MNWLGNKKGKQEIVICASKRGNKIEFASVPILYTKIKKINIIYIFIYIYIRCKLNQLGLMLYLLKTMESARTKELDFVADLAISKRHRVG